MNAKLQQGLAGGPAASGMRLPGRVLVVQPLQGIGDMIWHLPHLTAVASHTETGRFTLLAKPSSRADELLEGMPSIERIIWLDRRPRGGKRNFWVTGLLRLAGSLRREQFDSALILHHSETLALVLRLAGIRNRFGYGHGFQRLFLNRPPYLRGAEHKLRPSEQADTYCAAAGWRLESAEALLKVGDAARRRVAERLAGRAGPLVAIGVGSSEPYKQWGEPRYAELIAALHDAGWPLLAVIGGAPEAGMIERLAAGCAAVVPVIDWPLGEVCALLDRATFYVGNDTGVLNLAAALARRSYGLFGASPPLLHSPYIVALTPPGGPVDRGDGMGSFTLAAVLEAIARDRGTIAPLADREFLVHRASCASTSGRDVPVCPSE